MKAYGTRLGRMVSFFCGCLVPREMSPNCHWSRRLGGLHNWLDTLEEREISYPYYFIYLQLFV